MNNVKYDGSLKIDFYEKYMKYKQKYINLKNQIGGMSNYNIVPSNHLIADTNYYVINLKKNIVWHGKFLYIEGKYTVFMGLDKSARFDESWIFLRKDPVKRDLDNIFKTVSVDELIRNQNYTLISLKNKETYSGKYRGRKTVDGKNILIFHYNTRDIEFVGDYVILKVKDQNN
jgi:hypothetical protein